MPLLVAPTLAARSAKAMHLLRIIYAFALLRIVIHREKDARFQTEVPERPVSGNRRHPKGPNMLSGDVAQHRRPALTLSPPGHPLTNRDLVRGHMETIAVGIRLGDHANIPAVPFPSIAQQAREHVRQITSRDAYLRHTLFYRIDNRHRSP